MVSYALDCPILVNKRKEQIHLMRHFFKSWWHVIADIDGLFAVSTAKLGEIRYRRIIQSPKSVLVKCLNALFKADFNAICEEIILPEEVLFLDSVVEVGIVFLANRH